MVAFAPKVKYVKKVTLFVCSEGKLTMIAI